MKEACSLLSWEELPNPSFPLMFIHSEEEEARDEDSPSWFNFREKEIVGKVIKQLLDHRGLRLTPDDIGVITPYRKQVQKINHLVHFLGSPYKDCKVGTVENFQGQERKVIILSLVRSRETNLAHDTKFKLGFCDNPKRLNVAISRAKDLLIIVGNGKLFGSNDIHWAALLTYFKLHNLFKGPIPTWNIPNISHPPFHSPSHPPSHPPSHTHTPSHSLPLPPPLPTLPYFDINADLGWDNDGK